MSDIDVTIQELKHEVKAKKSLDKKTKKQKKRGEKQAKKIEAKQVKKEKTLKKLSDKAGVDHASPVSKKEGGETIIDWSRRSDVPIDKVELKLDSLFEPRGEEIQKRWKEKYGDDADIPEDMLRPKVDMKDLERGVTTVSTEGKGKSKGALSKKKGKLSLGGFGDKEKKISEPSGELSLLALKKPPEGLWLYQKFGQDKPKIVSLIIMLISLVLYIVPMLFIRIVFFILFKILAIVKGVGKKVAGKKKTKAAKS